MIRDFLREYFLPILWLGVVGACASLISSCSFNEKIESYHIIAVKERATFLRTVHKDFKATTQAVHSHDGSLKDINTKLDTCLNHFDQIDAGTQPTTQP